jgi:large subunit ribosomal protein L4
MKVDIYDKKKKKSSLEVPKAIAEAKINEKLISQCFRVEKLAKKRPAHTKTRAERSGGGAKPWRQKGTGRARHGSIRSPLWRKGGITFGPRKTDNYRKKVNKNMKRQAIKSLLADQIEKGQIILIDNFPKYEKTKKWEGYIAEIPIDNPGTILLALDDDQLASKKYINNIPYIRVVGRSGINIYNLLNFDYLFITKQLAEKLFKSLI